MIALWQPVQATFPSPEAQNVPFIGKGESLMKAEELSGISVTQNMGTRAAGIAESKQTTDLIYEK